MKKYFNNFELKEFFTPKITSNLGESIITVTRKKRNEISLLEVTKIIEHYLNHTSYKTYDYKERFLEYLDCDLITDVTITYNEYGDSFPVVTFVNKLRRNVLSLFTQVSNTEVSILDSHLYSEFSEHPIYKTLEKTVTHNMKSFSKYVIWNHLRTYAEAMFDTSSILVTNSNFSRISLKSGTLSFEFESPSSSLSFVYSDGDYSFSKNNFGYSNLEKLCKRILKCGYINKADISNPLLGYLVTLPNARHLSKENVKELISIYAANAEDLFLL